MADVTKITLPNGTTKDIKDTTARSNVVLLETMNGAKNIAPYNSGEHTGNASYWFLHPNCIDIAAGTSLYFVYDYTQTAGQISIQLTDSNGNIISGTSSYSTQDTTSGHKATKVTVPSGKTAKGYNAYHSANATVTISNFMIIPAEIYDAGFTSYQPYALPNTKITPELIELVDSGAKNLLVNKATTTTSSAGLTYTVNADKSITVTGNSTRYNAFNVSGSRTYADALPLPKGKYMVSGGIPLTSQKPIYIQFGVMSDSTASISWHNIDNVPYELTIDNDTTRIIYELYSPDGAYSGYNVTFYPMICTKAAWDVSQKYVPYRPTYEETVEQVATNKNNILTLQQRTGKVSAIQSIGTDYTLVSNVSYHAGLARTILMTAALQFNNEPPRGIIISKSNNSSNFNNGANLIAKAETTESINILSVTGIGVASADTTYYVWAKSAVESNNAVYLIYQDFTS